MPYKRREILRYDGTKTIVANLVQQSAHFHLDKFWLRIGGDAREKLCEYDTEGVKVTFLGVDIGRQDFRCCIDWSSDVLSHAALDIGAEGADAEVTDLGHALTIHQNVGGFQIAMDDGRDARVMEVSTTGGDVNSELQSKY